MFDQLLHFYSANADLRDFAGLKPRSYGGAEVPEIDPGLLGMQPVRHDPRKENCSTTSKE